MCPGHGAWLFWPAFRAVIGISCGSRIFTYDGRLAAFLFTLQIGGIDLKAKVPDHTSPLQAHQAIIYTSAANSNVDAAAAAAAGPYAVAPEYGASWTSPGTLTLHLPTHPDFAATPAPDAVKQMPLGLVKGGRLGWVLGQGRVSNWYDHPLEILMDPQLRPDEPDVPAVTRYMLVVRPPKEPMQADYVHTVSFRKEYPDGEAELVYEHTRWGMLPACAMHALCNHRFSTKQCSCFCEGFGSPY